MIYRETSTGVFEAWNGERLSNGALLNPIDAQRLSADELEDLELFIPADAGAVPEGQIIVSTSVQRVAGVVKFVNELEDAPVTSPVEVPPQMIACALRINVEAGEVQAVTGAFRVAAIMMMDEGTFLVIFFSNLGPDEPFLVPNNGISSSIVEWGEDYAVIETRDAAGELITPACFGFSLYNF